MDLQQASKTGILWLAKAAEHPFRTTLAGTLILLAILPSRPRRLRERMRNEPEAPPQRRGPSAAGRT